MAMNFDLFAIGKAGTGSGKLEVHVMSAASNFQQFILQTPTCFPQNEPELVYLVADNKDLFGIKRWNCGAGKTEVHVASAASNYQQFVLQTGTALEMSNADYAFALGANRDLWVIKKKGAANCTEVHVLSAASNYQQFTKHETTCLHPTDHTFEFLVAKNGDVIAIKTLGTGTGHTEVHILSAASNYKSFALQTGTQLHTTMPRNFEFRLCDNGDLFAVKKFGCGSGKSEVHVLSAASKYTTFVLQTPTAIHETNDNWQFAMTA